MTPERAGEPVSGSPAIAVDAVSKLFTSLRGEAVLALQECSLTVGNEQFVSLVGPSGCGKSTLLRIIAGLTGPTAGAVSVHGQPVVQPNPNIGIVFQSPVLLPWRRVLQNVMYPIEILGLDRSRYRRRAMDLLEMVGLGTFLQAYPRELSGGMAQRVGLCRALVFDPSILLMDEPFGALDAMTRDEMNVELLRLWSERRKSVFFITHSISEAVFLSDVVVVMTPRPGRVDAVIPIDLPRPRTIDMRDEVTFGKYQAVVRSRIYASKALTKHEVPE